MYTIVYTEEHEDVFATAQEALAHREQLAKRGVKVTKTFKTLINGDLEQEATQNRRLAKMACPNCDKICQSPAGYWAHAQTHKAKTALVKRR